MCKIFVASVESLALGHSQNTNLGCRQCHALRAGLVDLGHPSVLSPIRCPDLLSDRPNLCIDERGIGEMIVERMIWHALRFNSSEHGNACHVVYSNTHKETLGKAFRTFSGVVPWNPESPFSPSMPGIPFKPGAPTMPLSPLNPRKPGCPGSPAIFDYFGQLP